MLQNIQNEKHENIINNINMDKEKQEIINKDSKDDKYSSNESEEKFTNNEIINNLLNKADNNNELHFKLNQPDDQINSLENIKQDIINFYLIEKQKYEERKREIETNKNYNYNMDNKINISNNKNSKRIRPNSATKSLKKNRFEKYDKERISYEIYHQYQKLNFNYNSIPFIQRMELYSLKRCLKDYKIEELTNLQSPKISEKEIVQTFNRLIEDSNRRLFKSKKISKQKNKNEIEINNKKNGDCIIKNKKTKVNYKEKNTYNKKKWDEIYEKRFGSKLKERNDKLEKKRKEKEEQIKKEEDNIIDNLNKKQEILNQRYGMKRNKSANNLTKSSIHGLTSNKYYIGNNKIITNLNQRLYYNEIKKRDFDYKCFLEKANELIDNNNEINNKKNTNKKVNKNLNIKTNTFRKGANGVKNKSIKKNSSAYNFSDFEEKNIDSNNNKEEEKNNFDKIIKDDIDLRISETSIVNNSNVEITGSGSINNKGKNDSAEKIIDRFFEN